MQEKDFLNQRYLRKRAMYLAYVAEAISKNGNYDLEFSYFNEEPLKPVLLVKPKSMKYENNFFLVKWFWIVFFSLKISFFHRKECIITLNHSSCCS